MKGKTTIILTNVETGEQEIHEDENLITNALDKIININVAMNLALDSYVLPFATKALGGIMLFDGKLEEDPDNIHFPAEAHLVGYAGQSVNTSDSHRGSFNAIESGRTGTGFVSVWDFGTSQANGVIRAVARTSSHAGANPLFWYNAPTALYTTNGSPSADRSWYPIRYDGEYVYMLKGNSSTHVMRMARVRIPMLRMGVGDYSGVDRTLELVASWSTLLTTYTYYNNQADMENHRNGYTQYVYADDPNLYEDGHDGFIYCMGYGADRTYNDYYYGITYFTINYGDGSYDKSETTRIQMSGYYSSGSVNGLWFAKRFYGHVHKGTLYRMANNRKLIYRIPLDNPASYSAIRVFPDASQDYVMNLTMHMSHEGALYIPCQHYTETGTTVYNGIAYADGTIVLPEYAYYTANSRSSDTKYDSYDWTCDDDLTVWGYGGGQGESITRMWAANYLGTINNLASDIVKTPAQTMKIVYTLTDIDDEDEGEGDDGSGSDDPESGGEGEDEEGNGEGETGGGEDGG